ncbi:P1 family peptidase [Rhodococcus sp. TAF43]|uniref:P1 family peptidase n=1 Tax=unclassified Rhodococcus (in: high G+C Gram-positive bacteria) TaxID=192944 RepID=UPI00158322D8|nr:P1 family peptidase [Rhodococcus sp. W8901]QKT11064.1 P1 family peptidase [Rhodococcus sp. W8901]
MTAPRSGPSDSLSDVAGVLVGHDHLLDPDATLGAGAATGCTVVLVPSGATAGVDVRGGGPGTRETDLLDPSHSVQQVHAVLLTGGSAYGLAAADGVMRWLEEHDHGIPMGAPGQVVPIVPGAVIFDLPVGDWNVRPTAEFGRRAASRASGTVVTGSVGAGTGARAGVIKGGVGSASTVIDGGPADGVTVAALMVANPVGAVWDPDTGLPWGLSLADAERRGMRLPSPDDLAAANELGAKTTVLNTTIGVIATDATLSKAACRRVAVAGHDGLARAIRPAHSPLDGDTIFALATGARDVPAPDGVPAAFPTELPILDAVCTAAAACVQWAIVDAILSATAVAGIPSYRDVFPSAFGTSG